MKKLITISLFIFWAIIVAVMVAGLVFYQKKNITCAPCALNNSSGGQTGSTTQMVLNNVELVKHNTVKDCWLLINNKIYNVSTYLTGHPGGVVTISPYCGKEATQAFNTKDIGRPHSTGAANLLVNYYIGDLNQKINQQTVIENIQKTNTLPTPVNNGEYEDD